MNLNKKTKIIILIVILFIFILVLFRKTLFKGELIIDLEAPYQITIDDETIHKCFEDICNISLKYGNKKIVITKNSYYPFIENIKISPWSKVKIKPKLDLLATLVHTDEFFKKEIPEYDFVKDRQSHMYKLVSNNNNPIIFFPKKIEIKQIIADNKFVLIISDKESYKIDIKNKEKQKINLQIPEIKESKWSINGRYLIYSEDNSNKIFLIDFEKQSIEELPLKTQIDSLDWVSENRIVFATSQNYEKGDYTNKNGYLINLKNEEGAISFLTYHLDENFYSFIAEFSEILELPTKLHSTKSANEIYFEYESEKFKINLEKI